jgi:hypothetical protein
MVCKIYLLEAHNSSQSWKIVQTDYTRFGLGWKKKKKKKMPWEEGKRLTV